jgi:hypothetical protein
MIPHYDYLQQAAYRIRTDIPWQRQLFLLRFPDKWKTPLTTLVPRRRDGKEIRSVPIGLLNQVITALVPDVITVARKAAIGESAPWIYSDVEVDAQSLFAIIATWVRATAKTPDLAAAVLKAMSPADLQAPGWETLEVDFSRLTTDTGGDPVVNAELYRLLPHVLAADLAAPGAVHEHLLPENPDSALEPDVEEDAAQMVHARSEFRRCPAGQGAEVVSWPPHYSTRKPMSFLLRLTAHSHAFSTDATVHLRAGVRRWAHKDVKLSYDRAHTVYLLPSLPWLPGLRHSRSFLTAPLEPWRKESPGTEAGFEYSARWGGRGKIGRILRELGCTDRLPDPEDLKKTPAAWLNADDAVALVYREGMYPTFSHPVSAGTSLADKIPLIGWVTDTLSEHLELVEPLKKGRQVILASKAVNAGKYSNCDDAALLRAAVANAVGSDALGIDIFWDTTHTRDYARRTLSSVLGINVPEQTDVGEPTIVATDELTARITVRPIGSWGGPLTVDDDIGDRLDRLQAAVTTRADHIITALGQAPVPTISIVEIRGKKSFTGRQRASDPKFAIKVGLSRTGRWSQCVTEAPPPAEPEPGTEPPKSDGSLEKLTKSWYDLLRQLGVRPSPLTLRPEAAITQAPAYLAFWLIRQNQGRYSGITRQIPVAVLIDPSGRDTRACSPGTGWLSLGEAQHAISAKHMLSDQKRSPEEIARFLSQTLTEVAGIHPALLLLTCAQNLRWGWPFLNNPELLPDTILFGDTAIPASSYPGLRHVRVRTSERDEAAECFAFNDDDQEGHSAAYWPSSGRIFLSTGDKPVSASKAVKTASKIVPRWKDGKLVNPSTKTMVWNHRPLEYTVAAIQEGDEPEYWAALAHQLRWAAPHYDNALALPWPLMVAKKLAEYVMPVQLLEEIAEEDTDADPEDAN